MNANAFCIALEIDPVRIGDAYSPVPLHCTLMHWFRSTRSAKSVEEMLRFVCSDHKPIELLSRQHELFGPNKDIPVIVIERNDALYRLHCDLYVMLRAANTEFSELRFVGSKYRPHVTTQKGRAFKPGRRCIADTAYIIQAMNSMQFAGKRIVGKCRIGQ